MARKYEPGTSEPASDLDPQWSLSDWTRNGPLSDWAWVGIQAACARDLDRDGEPGGV